MKKVLSVSLGSSDRDHRVETEILGHKFIIERVGTNGSIQQAIKLLKDKDGQVDAFGMGGIDLYIYIGNKKYTIRDAAILKNTPKCTPIVDGSGLKNTLERRVIYYLEKNNIISFCNKKVLLVSAADRFGMAQALEGLGAKLTCGDLLFSLGIPWPVQSLKFFYRVASVFAPIAVKLPFHMLYPIGEQQKQQIKEKYDHFYQEADIIAGDFHYIKKFMPQILKDKTIITNTVTQQDIYEIKERGVKCLVTTTPELMGRSFGTNVMEAVLVSLIDKALDKITEEDYIRLIEAIPIQPRIIDVQNFIGKSEYRIE